MQALEHEVMVKQKEVDELGRSLGELQNQFLQRHEELKRAHSEMQSMQHTHVELEARMAGEKEAHVRRVNELEDMVNISRQQLADKDVQHGHHITQMQGQMQGMREERQRLEDEMRQVQQNLEGVKGDLLKRVGQVEQYMAEEQLSQSRQDQVSQELQSCYSQIDEANRKHEAVRKEVAQKCDEIEQQMALTQVEQSKVAALETAIREVETTLEAEKSELNIELARLQEKLNAELMHKAQAAVQDARQTEQLKELKDLRLKYTNEQLRVRELETKLQDQTMTMQANEKIAAGKLEELQQTLGQVNEEFSTKIQEAEEALSEEKETHTKTREGLQAQLRHLENGLQMLRSETDHQLQDRDRIIHEIEGKLNDTQGNVMMLQTNKASLEHTLVQKESALEESLSKLAQMEHLLHDRAEAASSAARNAEIIVSECDTLRVQHTNAFAVLLERHEKMALAGKESSLSTQDDLAMGVYHLANSETQLQAKLEDVTNKMQNAEQEHRQELAARVSQFENDIGLVRSVGETARAKAEELHTKLQASELRNAEYVQWLEQMTGLQTTNEAQEHLRHRIQQHQQLLIDISEQLRVFLFAFPTHHSSAEGPVPALHIPSTTDLWSTDEFSSLHEGVLVSLRCALGMFQSAEERWQRQYADLGNVVEAKSTDLQRLELAIAALRKTQSTPVSVPPPPPPPPPRLQTSVSPEPVRSEFQVMQRDLVQQEVEQQDMLRQSSIESSIAALTGQIHDLKSDLAKDRKSPRRETGIEGSQAVQNHHSQERVTRLAENNRVLILELEEKRLKEEQASRDLFAREQQNQLLQAEVRRLRGGSPPGQSDPSLGGKVFDFIDTNRDGSIDRHEFATALQEGGEVLQGMQLGTFGSLKETTDTFRATGQNLQRLRQECQEYREELSRMK